MTLNSFQKMKIGLQFMSILFNLCLYVSRIALRLANLAKKTTTFYIMKIDASFFVSNGCQ